MLLSLAGYPVARPESLHLSAPLGSSEVPPRQLVGLLAEHATWGAEDRELKVRLVHYPPAARLIPQQKASRCPMYVRHPLGKGPLTH